MKISPRSFKPGHRGRPGVCVSTTPSPPSPASFRRCGGQGLLERTRRPRGVPLLLSLPRLPRLLPPAGQGAPGPLCPVGARGRAEPQPRVLTRIHTRVWPFPSGRCRRDLAGSRDWRGSSAAPPAGLSPCLLCCSGGSPGRFMILRDPKGQLGKKGPTSRFLRVGVCDERRKEEGACVCRDALP